MSYKIFLCIQCLASAKLVLYGLRVLLVLKKSIIRMGFLYKKLFQIRQKPDIYKVLQERVSILFW